MKFTYLIQAHNNPEQLIRLIEQLLSADQSDEVILHLDGKSALWRQRDDWMPRQYGERLALVENPEKVYWAHYSLTTSTYKLLKLACQRGFDYVHLLSGADWPITAREQIVAHCKANSNRPAYIDLADQQLDWRMQQFHLHNLYWLDAGKSQKWLIDKTLLRTGKAISRLAGWAGVKRNPPYDEKWSRGSAWWSFPLDIAETCCQEFEQFQRQGRLKFTTCSDEHVFQTIVRHYFPDRIASDQRYIDWDQHGAHPATLTRAHLAEIQASTGWFARKFDAQKDDFFYQAFGEF